MGDASTGVGDGGVAEVLFNASPSVAEPRVNDLKAAVTVSTLSHAPVHFSIEPVSLGARISTYNQFVVRCEPPSDEWIFVGFTQMPQPFHTALPNLDGFGTGVRVSTTMKPTPTSLTMCPDGANQSEGRIRFSTTVRVPRDVVSLTLNGSACEGTASLSSSASLTCGRFQLDQAHLHVTIGSGITRDSVAAEPLELINGDRTLDISLDATSAVPESNGCYGWQLQ